MYDEHTDISAAPGPAPMAPVDWSRFTGDRVSAVIAKPTTGTITTTTAGTVTTSRCSRGLTVTTTGLREALFGPPWTRTIAAPSSGQVRRRDPHRTTRGPRIARRRGAGRPAARRTVSRSAGGGGSGDSPGPSTGGGDDPPPPPPAVALSRSSTCAACRCVRRRAAPVEHRSCSRPAAAPAVSPVAAGATPSCRVVVR